MIKLKHLREIKKYCLECCKIKPIVRSKKFCSRECEKKAANEAGKLGKKIYQDQKIEEILVQVNKIFANEITKTEAENV